MTKGILSLPPLPADEDALPFATYRNYVSAILWIARDCFGSDFAGLHGTLTTHPRYPGLARGNIDLMQVRRHLRSAWSTELAMAAFPSVCPGEAIRYANVWVPVQGYYAVFSALLAWLRASGSTASSHRRVLDSIGEEMNTRVWLCPPWSVVCSGCPQLKRHTFARLDTEANLTLSNLSPPRDRASAWGLVAKCLQTTREDTVYQAFDAWKRDRKNYRGGKPRKALRVAEKTNIADKVAPTSVFDFFYRMRIRTNYKDTDAFALGPWTEVQAREFYRDVLDLTGSTLRFVEILVSGRVGQSQFLHILSEFGRDSRVSLSDVPPVQYWLKATGVPSLNGR